MERAAERGEVMPFVSWTPCTLAPATVRNLEVCCDSLSLTGRRSS